jgi:hypothetical protein
MPLSIILSTLEIIDPFAFSALSLWIYRGFSIGYDQSLVATELKVRLDHHLCRIVINLHRILIWAGLIYGVYYDRSIDEFMP